MFGSSRFATNTRRLILLSKKAALCKQYVPVSASIVTCSRIDVVYFGDATKPRWFSSNDDSDSDKKEGGAASNATGGGKGNQMGGRGGGRGHHGGRGGRGRGHGHGGGRGRGRGRGRHNTNKDPGFSKKFIEPAERGELKKHRSGIPKLAARPPKGHGVRGAIGGDDRYALSSFDENDDDYYKDTSPKLLKRSMAKPLAQVKNNNDKSIAKRPSRNDAINDPLLAKLSPEDRKKVLAAIPSGASGGVSSIPDVELYYWKEMDYEKAMTARVKKAWDHLDSIATMDENGNMVVEVEDDEEILAALQQYVVTDEQNDDDDDDNAPFIDLLDYLERDPDYVERGDDYNTVQPLKVEGPDMKDVLIETLYNHPTQFGTLQFDGPGIKYAREPIPDFPKNRANPPLDFVEGFQRFIYVTGLPPYFDKQTNQLGDFDNPNHRHDIQSNIANLFNVPSANVSPASLSSGFIGFTSREEQLIKLILGPKTNTLQGSITISPATEPIQNKQLQGDDINSIALIQGLPNGTTPTSLRRILFPYGTEVDKVYGSTVTAKDIIMQSPHSAWIRFESAEMAKSALLSSSLIQDQLTKLGQSMFVVQYFKARRELSFTGGTHPGLGNDLLLRELGPRLIVDGDLPTFRFFMSHYGVLQLRNLDSATTSKQELSNFFQTYCEFPRDVQGSIEFVTSYNGLPTDKVYIGFDSRVDFEKVIQTFRPTGGKISTLGPTVTMKSVTERGNKNRRQEQRSTRTEEELLDSLQNWQQYVDKQDLEYLASHDISVDALDETFRSVRYHNPTFAALDQAMRSESYYPEKAQGEHYKEFVQEYIETLKGCISTPEDPGPILQSLFMEGEEIDPNLWNRNKKRQAELAERRNLRP